MAHHEHAPAVGGEGADELVDGVEVEVVRRLVEHEQLRRRVGHEHARERQPEPLAARQRRDGAQHRVAAQQEPGEPVPQLDVAHARRRAPQVLERRGRVVEPVDPLRQVADAIGVRLDPGQQQGEPVTGRLGGPRKVDSPC